MACGFAKLKPGLGAIPGQAYGLVWLGPGQATLSLWLPGQASTSLLVVVVGWGPTDAEIIKCRNL